MSLGPLYVFLGEVSVQVLCPWFSFLNMIFIFYYFLRFYLFIFRERGREGERERETSMCGCLSRTPYWGPGPQPRHVPWLGIEPMALWFAGRHSIHWAAPAGGICLQFESFSAMAFCLLISQMLCSLRRLILAAELSFYYGCYFSIFKDKTNRSSTIPTP